MLLPQKLIGSPHMGCEADEESRPPALHYLRAEFVEVSSRDSTSDINKANTSFLGHPVVILHMTKNALCFSWKGKVLLLGYMLLANALLKWRIT